MLALVNFTYAAPEVNHQTVYPISKSVTAKASLALSPFYVVPSYLENKWNHVKRYASQIEVITVPHGEYAGLRVIPYSVVYDPIFSNLFTQGDINQLTLIYIDEADMNPFPPPPHF
jgi:hypothetical protein